MIPGQNAWFLHKKAGLQPGPMDAWLTCRGAKTLALRMRAHCENALGFAEFLHAHEQVSWVRYPYHSSHPQFELAQRQMSGGSGMVTMALDADKDQTYAFVSSLTFSLLWLKSWVVLKV